MSKNPNRHRPSRIQGEGNYEAARRYRQDAEEFAARRATERLARKAAPISPQEALELLEAEMEGRSRAKGAAPTNAAATDEE